ncbi:MAG: hypothetical protein CVV27_12870 [Candidatus Melainabacteria bacterium HGW-Melainabacteria-1]|nr:MAG: hypothetical protein CVV27_12870 [Candidatus Melainabacteria bacterium HGW-Melainabacteria-1]
MHLKRVFPDSLTLETDFDAPIRDTLWEISRCCIRIWNLALEQRRQDIQGVNTREQLYQDLVAGQPAFQGLARSVIERVFWSLDEAFEQYQQTQADFDAHRRPDMIAPPRPMSEADFFPLYYSSEFLRFNPDKNCLEISHQGGWLELELPRGDYHKAEAVIIMYHPERQHFQVEFNPVLVD